MKWADMTARERDATVSEKVMGVEAFMHGKYVKATWVRPGTPYYTTNISAAWKVVEKMKSNEWNMDLNNALVQFNSEHWHYVCFANGKHQIRRGAPTAPEAICLTALYALRAVGVDVE